MTDSLVFLPYDEALKATLHSYQRSRPEEDVPKGLTPSITMEKLAFVSKQLEAEGPVSLEAFKQEHQRVRDGHGPGLLGRLVDATERSEKNHAAVGAVDNARTCLELLQGLSSSLSNLDTLLRGEALVNEDYARRFGDDSEEDELGIGSLARQLQEKQRDLQVKLTNALRVLQNQRATEVEKAEAIDSLDVAALFTTEIPELLASSPRAHQFLVAIDKEMLAVDEYQITTAPNQNKKVRERHTDILTGLTHVINDCRDYHALDAMRLPLAKRAEGHRRARTDTWPSEVAAIESVIRRIQRGCFACTSLQTGYQIEGDETAPGRPTYRARHRLNGARWLRGGKLPRCTAKMPMFSKDVVASTRKALATEGGSQEPTYSLVDPCQVISLQSRYPDQLCDMVMNEVTRYLVESEADTPFSSHAYEKRLIAQQALEMTMEGLITPDQLIEWLDEQNRQRISTGYWISCWGRELYQRMAHNETGHALGRFGAMVVRLRKAQNQLDEDHSQRVTPYGETHAYRQLLALKDRLNALGIGESGKSRIQFDHAPPPAEGEQPHYFQDMLEICAHELKIICMVDSGCGYKATRGRQDIEALIRRTGARHDRGGLCYEGLEGLGIQELLGLAEQVKPDYDAFYFHRLRTTDRPLPTYDQWYNSHVKPKLAEEEAAAQA